MGMYAFRLTLLLCSLTIYNWVESASVLDNSSDPWQNWLLKEDEELHSPPGSPLSRRITPKSVFIAPRINPCQQGYRPDEMGTCVRVVRIDELANEAARLNMLLQKLNSLYAKTKEKDSAEATSTETSSSTLYAKENENSNDSKDSSGPFQLNIPFSSKNSSEYMDDDLPMIIRNDSLLNFSVSTEMTTAEINGTDNLSELITDDYGTETTSILSEETTITTYAEDSNSQTDTEFTTRIMETTTLADNSVTSDLPPLTELPSLSQLPKRSYMDGLRVESSSSKPIAAAENKATSVANVIYHYPSENVLKLPFRFPESAIDNYSSTTERSVTADIPNRTVVPVGNRLPTSSSSSSSFEANRKHHYHRENSMDNNKTVNSNDDGSISNIDRDISDSYVSSSGSIGSTSGVSLSDSINSSKNGLYQKLPSSGRTRPKCDPTSSYSDCISDKLNELSSDSKSSYLVNANRAPVTTFIRFPGGYNTKGSTSVVRFPSTLKQSPPSADANDAVAFPESDIASRYWESSRYPTAYWNPWDVSKPQFVRIWPGNGVVASTAYNADGGDVSGYNLRSQSSDYS